MKIRSAFSIRLLLSMVLLISCANLPSKEMTGPVPLAAGPPTKMAELPPRPILYFDGEKLEGGARELVIKGVYPDGHQLGTLTRGKIAGWSPDGMWFAFFAGGGASPETVNVMNLQGVVKTIFTPGPGEEIFSSGWQSIWSPEGGRIALILMHRDDFESVAVINVADSNIISRHRLPSTALGHPTYKFRWSPDGRKILLVSKTTVVVDTVAGTVETIAEKPTPAEWSPGSDAVFYFDGLWHIEDFLLRKLGDGKSLKLMDKERILASGLGQPVALLHGVLMTLSPSGSKLAIAGGSIKGGLPQLKGKGKVTRGYLGILIQEVTPEIADALGLDKAQGALVANVSKGGPSERAGVKVGDVIVEFAGKEIKESDDLPILVARTAVDKKVRLKVLREKKDVTLYVTVGERKEEEDVASTGGAVHIYDLTNTEVPTLDKPRARFETEDVIISIQWAPDESSLAVITHLGVKILHLATGEWRTLAALSNSPRGTEIDVVAFINTLSWTE